jgi:hypothetical protein
MLTERLLATLGRVHRWRLATLVVGIALEVAVVLGIGSDDSLAGVRGIGGESAALLSVVGAVIAGPAVGVGMALVGWIVFFPLIADSSAASVLALPEWVGVALLVGLISRALVALEGRRVQTENDIRAAHALRTPGRNDSRPRGGARAGADGRRAPPGPARDQGGDDPPAARPDFRRAGAGRRFKRRMRQKGFEVRHLPLI